MFQKIQKKVKEFFKEKGQGVVEYALLLGFVAIVAAYLSSSSGLIKQSQDNMNHINEQAKSISDQYVKSPTAGG